MADPEFEQLYEERLAELKSKLYESGDAAEHSLRMGDGPQDAGVGPGGRIHRR